MIVQGASKSLPFLIGSAAACLLPAYSGEAYPPQISEGVDQARDSFANLTAAKEASDACSVLFIHKNQASLPWNYNSD